MPALQTVNFGADPRATAMGNFARSFLGTLTEKAETRKNDRLFKEISDKYGPDGNAEDMLLDILKSEGLSQEYKKSKIPEVIQYANLKNKKSRTKHEDAVLDNRKKELEIREESNRIASTRATNESNRIGNTKEKNKLDLPIKIAKHTSTLLKDQDLKLPIHDINDLNAMAEQYMSDEENPLSLPEATNKAYEYIQARRDKINEVEIPKPPHDTGWIYTNVTPEQTGKAMEEAYEALKFLYEEDGITNQTELRAIAKRAGWQPDQVRMLIDRVFKDNGRKLKGPKPKQISKQDLEDDALIFG
jgi:hypothetical protein